MLIKLTLKEGDQRYHVIILYPRMRPGLSLHFTLGSLVTHIRHGLWCLFISNPA